MSVLSFIQLAGLSLRQRASSFSEYLGDYRNGMGERTEQSPSYGKTAAGGYLLGAGPDDPELLTRKGERLLRAADVVLYDNLVSPEVLSLCRRSCQQIYVGKRAGQHAMPQAQINQLLVEYGKLSATANKVIVRLKGGDPTIFGRVTEEATALEQAGLQFAVVPGITSACAAAIPTRSTLG